MTRVRSKPTRNGNGKRAATEPDRRSGSLALRRAVEPATPGQRRYVRAIRRNDITVCDGPAGTGKTFLAAGVAVHDITAELGPLDGDRERRRRIVVCRPAVNAGEDLGFKPGPVEKKMAGYVAPVYEAIELHSRDEQEYRRLTDPKEGIVRVVPFETMRGVTFRHAWVILDEAQNTTPRQMELFLGRIGEGSRLVIVGDREQSDLIDRHGAPIPNGLEHALSLEGCRFRRGRVGIVHLGLEDCVRHDLIAEILRHYAELRRAE